MTADTDRGANGRGSEHSFRTVLQGERRHLGLSSEGEQLHTPEGVGLAISGGGIRSAAFGLGVVQALVNRNLLRHFHYLSTVSGGGYLGAALTWLRKLYPEEREFKRQLGSRTHGVRSTEFKANDGEQSNIWLDYIRQHGNYLKPPRFSDLTLAGIVLRGAVLSLLVYGGALTALLAGLIYFDVIAGLTDGESGLVWQSIQNFVLLAAMATGLLIGLFGIATWAGSQSPAVSVIAGYIALSGLGAVLWWVCRLVYADAVPRQAFAAYWPLAGAISLVLMAWIPAVWQATRRLLHGAVPDDDLIPESSAATIAWHYIARTGVQKRAGAMLAVLLLCLGVWAVAALYGWLYEYTQQKNLLAILTGSTGGIAGVASAIYQFVTGRERANTKSSGSNIRIIGSAVLLVFGLAMLAYGAAATWFKEGTHIAVLAVAVLVLGALANVNYIGVARMYRDRLMESFMPDKEAIRSNKWHVSPRADKASIAVFGHQPLHLVNCNVVMIDSSQDKFRGRGGDSFVISPLFSGSSATGWIDSKELGDGSFSLATAMAISGAAANPNTGSAGQGVTRNRFVSLLLSLLNVRLGYWVRNPNARGVRHGLASRIPANFWWPGLWQGLFGRNLSENATFLELTDGGHFDNTGLYELIRRRVKIIVLSQASQDKEYGLADLATLIERVRVDFGVHIRFEKSFDVARIRPTGTPHARSETGFAIASIHYPRLDGNGLPVGEGGGSDQEGVLLYLQSAPLSDMRPDVESYCRLNQDFPNQTTADQFFNEDQLEAYRELGLTTADSALTRLASGMPEDPATLRELQGVLRRL